MKLHCSARVGIVTDDLESGIQRHKALFNSHLITKIVRDTIQPRGGCCLAIIPRATGHIYRVNCFPDQGLACV